jgi:hypothetical protein
VVSVVEDNLGKVADLCRKYKVRRLELFGSALTGENFDVEKSDVDFLVEFLPLEAGEHAHTYFGLLRELGSVLGRKVDLVEIRAVKNPYFLESVNENRKEIYAA